MIAHWRINYVNNDGVVDCYLGRHRIGEIRLVKDSHYGKKHYCGSVCLPGMVGPVSREDDIYDCKVGLSKAIREWLEDMDSAVEVEAPKRRKKEEVKPLRVRRVR